MDDNHPRAVLAANLARLMQHGKEQRKLRRRGGPATAVELESKAGIGDSTISRYRHNAAAANLDDLYKIALAYDLQVWELLYPDLNPAAPPATQRAALGVNDVLKAAHDLYMRQGGIDGGGFKTGGAAGADTHRVAPGKHPARKGR
jgi:transcriptional regulator with XRE-family HTH domain